MFSDYGFIIDSFWNESNRSISLYVKSPSSSYHLVFDQERPLFFIPKDCQLPNNFKISQRKDLPLKSFDGKEVSCLYFSSLSDLNVVRKYCEENGIRSYENDVRPESRFLMERFIKGGCEFSGEIRDVNGIKTLYNPQIKPSLKQVPLKSVSLDIETSRQNQLLSIGLTLYDGDKLVNETCYMLANEYTQRDNLFLLDTEAKLLESLNQYFKDTDPDLILGWHVIGFDLKFLYEKSLSLGVPLFLSRNNKPLVVQENENKVFCELRGRQVIDGPPILRQNFFFFSNYKLDTVAKEVLDIGKDIEAQGGDKVEEIERRFHEDKEALAHYNLLDCKLVFDIYKKLSIIDLLIARSFYSGQILEKVGFSTASFDHYMLPLIHRKGYVAPNVFDINREEQAVGGMVIEPEIGLFENVAVFDFKSLYPSIINTFKIDPYSLIKKDINPIKTPSGYQYSKTENILPDVIEKLLHERQMAKDKGFNSLSQAIKILMNSFYGVMGSSRSRFYHSDLAQSITQSGHWILNRSKDFFENKGYRVLYGDTDSLFVKFDFKPETKEIDELVKDLNYYFDALLRDEFNVESKLDLEFEKLFDKIFFSLMRNATGGAKKRYAGIINHELQFVGMEYVRSDWTKLAKSFQYSLFEALFSNDDIEVLIKKTISDLENGLFDDSLILKKRLSKRPWEYIKSIPPHIKAALELSLEEQKTIREIEYIMTVSGPKPISQSNIKPDYKYYIEKQIRPIAQSVLQSIGLNFDSLIEGDQLSLF